MAPGHTFGREWPGRGRSMHFHSLDETLIAGDGGRDLESLPAAE